MGCCSSKKKKDENGEVDEHGLPVVRDDEASKIDNESRDSLDNEENQVSSPTMEGEDEGFPKKEEDTDTLKAAPTTFNSGITSVDTTVLNQPNPHQTPNPTVSVKDMTAAMNSRTLHPDSVTATMQEGIPDKVVVPSSRSSSSSTDSYSKRPKRHHHRRHKRSDRVEKSPPGSALLPSEAQTPKHDNQTPIFSKPKSPSIEVEELPPSAKATTILAPPVEEVLTAASQNNNDEENYSYDMTHEPFPFPSDILPFREEPPHRWGSDYNYGDRPSYAYGYDDRDRYRPSDYVPRASYPYPTPVSHADPYSPYPVSRLTEEPKTFYYTLPKSVPPSGDDGARLMEADEAFQVGEIQGTSLPGYFEGGIDQAEYKWYDEHNVAEVPYSTVNEDLYSPWKAENTGLQRDEVEGRGELPAATVESFPYNTPGYLNTADTADPEYYIFEEDTYADPLYTQHAARGDPSLPYSYYTPSYSASLPQRDTYLANNLDQW